MTNEWLDRNEYPFASRYFNLQSGVKLHYIEVGEGDTLLFIHGTPSWSFDYRHLIKALSPNYRCIAIDHIGFGLSDKPADFGYSTQGHSEHLEAFIIDKELKNITLIMHDFGGPIGMQVAIQHPHLFKAMVVFNSWMWSMEDDPAYQKVRWVLKSPLLPFLYRYLNFSPRYLLPGSFGSKKLPSKTLKQYTSPFKGPKDRFGPLAFARSLLHDHEWFESLWQHKEIISTKPVLLIWGMMDKFIGPEYLQKFKSGFKNTQSIRLADCGHFPQEECHDEVVLHMEKFLIEHK